MAKRNKSRDEAIERSPLVDNDINMPSTINPEKLEFSRFTDMQNEETGSNPLKIFVYIIVVVSVGVITALVVRNLIVSNNSRDVDTQTQIQQSNSEAEQSFVLSTVSKPDNTLQNVANNEDYKESRSITVGESSLALSEITLEKIEYNRLTTFSRFTFKFTGNNQRLPQINISFSQTERKLTVDFSSIGKISDNLKKNTMIDNFVKSVSFVPATNSFDILVSEAFKYRVTNEAGNLILDIKSNKEIEKSESFNDTSTTTNQTSSNANTNSGSSSTTTTNNSQTTSDQSTQTNAPAAPFYKNEFGQGTQYVSSNLKTNTLIQNNYWAWDEGSFFEFSFGRQGLLGDSYIPNSKAYYDNSVKDKVILVWEISNLQQATLSTKGSLTAQEIQNVTGISLAGANFIKVDFVELKDGKAIYKIELKNKADFQLLTQQTYDKTTQIISVRIKD